MWCWRKDGCRGGRELWVEQGALMVGEDQVCCRAWFLVRCGVGRLTAPMVTP